MRPKSFDQSEALNAAMLQFWEAGYETSSMQRLVDRMGISRQSLYDTYGNKRELFRAALKRYRNERIEPVITDILRPEIGAIDALRAFLISALEGRTDSPSGCLLVRTASECSADDSAVAELVDRCIGEIRGALRERIERGQQSGELVAGRAAGEIADELIALAIGLQIIHRLPNLGRSVRPSIDSLLTTLIPGSRSGACP